MPTSTSIIIGLIILLLFFSLFMVKQQTAAIIERFGKFQSIRHSGLQIKIPIIDRIIGRISLRVLQLDVTVETKTSDNVFVKLKVSVQYKVIKDKVYEAFYKLDFPQDQITSYVFDVVRAVVPKMKLDDAIEGTRHHLLKSVELRLRADVPIAFCLSGGVDSSGLVSIAKKVFDYDVATFSIIDLDERYNEADNIEATINDLNCKNHLVNLDYDNMFERLTDLIKYHDSPISTITYLVHSMLSEKISMDGYKISVSGTSADELFTGYYDHFLLHL